MRHQAQRPDLAEETPVTRSLPQSLTKNDFAYIQLRELILTGALEPGSPLQQGRLAEEMGVSTTPLREAIRRLNAEGLITLAAHRDARVAEVTQREAEDLFTVRQKLDPLAAELAATAHTEAEIEAILEAEARLTPLTVEGNIEALLAHREFHRRIYHASHNEILIDMLERVWDKADRYRIIGLRRRGDSAEETERVANEHHELTLAIQSREPERARKAMETHISDSLGRRAIEEFTADKAG